MAKLREIIAALERLAPLKLQDEWDNSGLQVGFPDAEISRVLVCLDITEAIVEEAIAKECNLIVSHHPLLFKPLRQVVNHKIASLLGLQGLRWLSPLEGEDAGAGLVGELPQAERDAEFLARVKRVFGVQCLRHSALDGRMVRRVALCGGAGAFLLRDAIRAGADCFLSGEFHYHDYFENAGVLLAELGHFQSEQYTQDLLQAYLQANCPGVEVVKTGLDTNPICYDGLPER